MLNLKLQGRGKSQGTQRREVWAIMVRTLHNNVHTFWWSDEITTRTATCRLMVVIRM